METSVLSNTLNCACSDVCGLRLLTPECRFVRGLCLLRKTFGVSSWTSQPRFQFFSFCPPSTSWNIPTLSVAFLTRLASSWGFLRQILWFRRFCSFLLALASVLPVQSSSCARTSVCWGIRANRIAGVTSSSWRMFNHWLAVDTCTCLIAACVAGEGFAQIDKEPRRQSEEVRFYATCLSHVMTRRSREWGVPCMSRNFCTSVGLSGINHHIRPRLHHKHPPVHCAPIPPLRCFPFCLAPP